jgi:hypothetical protein
VAGVVEVGQNDTDGVDTTAEPVKSAPVTFPPLIVTEREGGVNVYPDLLAVIVYEPFGSPAKL